MGSVFTDKKPLLQPWQPKSRAVSNRPKTKHEENDLQLQIARYIRKNYPHVIFISSGNGLNKTKAQAGIWRAINSDKGQPDMLLLFPSQGYFGLCIELKKEGFKVYKRDGTIKRQMVKVKNKYGIVVEEYNHLQRQEDCLKELNRLGYLARFVSGYDNAIRLIDGYMGTLTAEMF